MKKPYRNSDRCACVLFVRRLPDAGEPQQNRERILLYRRIVARNLCQRFHPQLRHGIKNFVDGDKNADTHSWDGAAGLFHGQLFGLRCDELGDEQLVAAAFDQLLSRQYAQCGRTSDAVLNHYEGAWGVSSARCSITLRCGPSGPFRGTRNRSRRPTRRRSSRIATTANTSHRKILADLDYACTYCLTSAPTKQGASYIHRYVALALKARFCLYEGTMRKYHAVDPVDRTGVDEGREPFYLGECVKACEEIIGDGVYQLTDDPAKRRTQYRVMFTNADACGVYTDEFIWARDYDIDLKVTYAINNYMVNPQHANYAFTRQFIDTYLMTDGTPFTEQVSRLRRPRPRGRVHGSRLPSRTDDPHAGFHARRRHDAVGSRREVLEDGLPADQMAYRRFVEGYQYGCHRYGRAPDTLRRSAARLCRSEGRTERNVGGGLEQDDQTAARTRGSEEHLSHGGRPLHGRIFPESGDRSFHSGGAPRTGYRADDGEQPLPDDIIRWHQGELFARPWKGVWISAVDTPLDLNADGTPETIVTANPKQQSTLNILMIDGASEAGHKLSRGTSGNILPSTALERKWQDYKYVKPIPTTARQENPNLTQNPKW